MSNAQPTHDIYALAAAVRDGGLSLEQREQLVRLLHRIESAYGLAPLAAQRYPDTPERRTPMRPLSGSRSPPSTPGYCRVRPVTSAVE
jgi:hypothetical protein